MVSLSDSEKMTLQIVTQTNDECKYMLTSESKICGKMVPLQLILHKWYFEVTSI